MRLINGDCLEVMKEIPDKSIDMILADPPYGTTSRNKWDVVIPFEPMWEQINRVIKDDGAILIFSQLPFSCDLIQSNRKYFRYEWVYEKPNASGFLNANRMPLKCHENILVFYKKLPTYNPQKAEGKPYLRKTGSRTSKNYGVFDGSYHIENKTGDRYPRDIIKFNKETGLHPTQKPVQLLEYLVKTYTNENETVLDSCMGSGSTGVACKNLNRNFIGIELDEKYFNIARNRIESV